MPDSAATAPGSDGTRGVAGGRSIRHYEDVGSVARSLGCMITDVAAVEDTMAELTG